MAFSEALPRNSESRAIGVAMRILRKHAPHLQWVISFADGAQCGDGTIYRAAGFVLTGIKENKEMLRMPGGAILNKMTITKGTYILNNGSASVKREYLDKGAEWLPGFQLRYIYFLDPSARERLTVPVLPFSEIERRGAGMYRGQPRAASIDSDAPDVQSGEGGADPTAALQTTHQGE